MDGDLTSSPSVSSGTDDGLTSPTCSGDVMSPTHSSPDLTKLNLHGTPTPSPSPSASGPSLSPGSTPEAGSRRPDGPPSPLAGEATSQLQSACTSLGDHVKHVFVFSTAGKPIFSQHGSEEDLAEVMATARAIMSVVQSLGQSIRYLRCGPHVIAFLERSPLCLLAVSSLAEPPPVLRMQLALVHGQIISLLTASALGSVFKRSPAYDARKLLRGTDPMLRLLVDSFFDTPAALLGAFPALPMLKGVRAAVTDGLRTAVNACNALFGLVVSAGCVVALVGGAAATRRQVLQQWDVLLLLNFLQANEESFKLAETFTPLCLPSYNPNGHLHAYIHYVDAATRTAIVLLVAGSSPDFHPLSTARQEWQERLEVVGALQAVMQAGQQYKAPACMLHPTQLPELAGDSGGSGASPLLHFAYKLSLPQQFVMSPFGSAGIGPKLRQDLVVTYSQVRAAMFNQAGENTSGPLQRLRYEARQSYTVMASVGMEAELYLTLDALTDKQTALRACSKLLGWLRSRHQELFGVA